MKKKSYAKFVEEVDTAAKNTDLETNGVVKNITTGVDTEHPE